VEYIIRSAVVTDERSVALLFAPHAAELGGHSKQGQIDG